MSLFAKIDLNRWTDLPKDSVANIKFPDDYVKNGFKKKLKMPPNIKVKYSGDSNKIKIREIKIYEHAKLVRMFHYNDDENFKVRETIYFYDNNSSSYTSKITRSYTTPPAGILSYEAAKDAKNNGIYTKYFYRKSIKDKGKMLSLYLYIQHDPEIIHRFRYSRDKRVEEEGYSIRRGYSSFRRYFNKKGIVVKEYSYYNGFRRNNILDGFYYTYDDNGTLISEKYYDDGKYKYGSYCKFDTTNYIYRLKKKYNKNMLYTRRGDAHCKKISDNVYAIAIPFGYSSNEGYIEFEDEIQKVNLMLALVDIKTQKIIFTTYNENTNFNSLSSFQTPYYMNFFTNYSYDAQTNSDIFDFSNDVSRKQVTISYKITPKSIELLKSSTYTLKDVLQSVKNNKHLSIKNIIALLKEVKINSKSVTTYNNIAYYLQKNGYHKEAILILQNVLERYSNRTVAYLNMADSLYELNKKDLAKSYYVNYTRWMKLNHKENKIPKRVFKRIK